jgi:hypothetical protein
MLARRETTGSAGVKDRRRGAAAVEFACCLPFLSLILTGLWQVGRITQLQEIVWNSAREAARDASLGQDNLQAVASSLLFYLQGADPVTFGQGHQTALIARVVSLPANTSGYTCWDNTANRELFTLTFSDLTNTSIGDPTGMKQLDLYSIGVQVPFGSVAWSSVVPIAGTSRFSANVVWASMVDSPFQIAPNLPAQ